MGRRKISISQITDPKLRNITFIKRRHGLIKKAAELSLLCNVNMLVIFEDVNGSLIQFSRNKVTTIPAFFKECRYNSVCEFTAKDYPNFFNVSHKRKRRERKNDDESNKQAALEQEDVLPVLEDLKELAPEVKIHKKVESVATAPLSNYEDHMSPGMISYASSEESNHEGRDGAQTIPNIQTRENYYHQPRPVQRMEEKPRAHGLDESQKAMTYESEIVGNCLEEQEMCKREPYQNHQDLLIRGPIIEDKSTAYIPPYIPTKRPAPMRGLRFTEDGPYYYRDFPFEPNMPPYFDYHPNRCPYGYYDGYPYRPRNFGYPMRSGTRIFREISDEEAVDNMFRYPPKGPGMGPRDPYANMSRRSKSEFVHMSEYVKPRERATHYVDPDYQEMNPHHRGSDYVYDDSISSNHEETLPAPYFNPGKFGPKGYYANSFESDGFTEFSEPQKKVKL